MKQYAVKAKHAIANTMAKPLYCASREGGLYWQASAGQYLGRIAHPRLALAASVAAKPPFNT